MLINIVTIWTYLATTVSRNIFKYYAIIGCDATLFFNINWKINPTECLCENRSWSNADIEDFLPLIQTACYGRNIYETYVIARISTYCNQKTKISTKLAPDLDSAVQVIFLVHYQC